MNRSLELFAVAHKSPDVIVPKGIKIIGTNGYAGDFQDNEGINIAARNARWSELTAIYWLINNYSFTSTHVGLCHYRRYFAPYSCLDGFSRHQGLPFFMLNPQEFEGVQEEVGVDALLSQLRWLRADVILPEPFIAQSTILRSFVYYHKTAQQDLIATFQSAIKKGYLTPSFAKWFLDGREMYPCNMAVCPVEIFVSIWKKVFEVLLDIEATVTPKESHYQNRTFAFIAERIFAAIAHFDLQSGERRPITRLLPIIMINA